MVRRLTVARLDEAVDRSGRAAGRRVGAIDETSQVKQGERAGVKLDYVVFAGKVANRVTTMHVSYVRERTGHALIGARQGIPAEHRCPVRLPMRCPGASRDAL